VAPLERIPTWSIWKEIIAAYVHTQRQTLKRGGTEAFGQIVTDATLNAMQYGEEPPFKRQRRSYDRRDDGRPLRNGRSLEDAARRFRPPEETFGVNTGCTICIENAAKGIKDESRNGGHDASQHAFILRSYPELLDSEMYTHTYKKALTIAKQEYIKQNNWNAFSIPEYHSEAAQNVRANPHQTLNHYFGGARRNNDGRRGRGGRGRRGGGRGRGRDGRGRDNQRNQRYSNKKLNAMTRQVVESALDKRMAEKYAEFNKSVDAKLNALGHAPATQGYSARSEPRP